jgi:cell division protein FtsI/penicillin-binding protein 2
VSKDVNPKSPKVLIIVSAGIKYIEVPGGDHSSVAAPAVKDIFDWFDAHKRQPAGAKAAAKAAGSQ